MSNSENSIVRTLNDDAFQERESIALERFKASVRTVNETVQGYSFIFPYSDDQLREIADFIAIEHQCCPFLHFDLKLGSGQSDITLELFGSDQVKLFIASTFLP
jgi:hypothetical protein